MSQFLKFILLFLVLLVHLPEHEVQCDVLEKFRCTFSGCVDTELVCNCTVPNGTLFWWDGDAKFCSRTFLNDSGGSNRDGVCAEVIRSYPSGAFTSMLRFNVSIGLNDTEVGCSQSTINATICRPSITDQNSTFKLLVTGLDCQESSLTAPTPPRYLNLSMIEDAQCDNPMRNVTITWEPSLSQVANYTIRCTSADGEDSCVEVLPANNTSFNLRVNAGVWYTITVSAVIDGIESESNPQLNFFTVQLLNHTTTESHATLWFQVSNTTCNLTVSYEVCSDTASRNYSTLLFTSPAVHLVNLTAGSTYCYLISATDSASGKIVAGSCNGTFTTEVITGTTNIVGKIIGGVVGGALILIHVGIGVAVYCRHKRKNSTPRDSARK